MSKLIERLTTSLNFYKKNNKNYSFYYSYRVTDTLITVLVSDSIHQTSHAIIDDLNNTDFETIINELIDMHEKLIQKQPDYQWNGPTNEELQKYPCLKSTWNEYIMMRKICGL